MNRMLVIGLDGATFEVLRPLMNEGLLPNIRNIIDSGASGVLQSTMPPVTGPAWFALATGLTPGKSGIFDFIFRENSVKNKFRFINSTDFRHKAVWDILSRAGRKVCLYNYPCLYPPYPVNGFMICGGLGSPSLSGFTYPADIESKITNFVGYNRQLNLKTPEYKDLDIFLADLHKNFEADVQAVEFALRQDSWDFTWVVFSQTDWLQHMLWRYFDKSSMSSLSDFDKYNHAFKKFWVEVDTAIGRLRNCVSESTNIVILSDHGFGSVGESFRLNAWLRQQGYLTLSRGGWQGFVAVKKIRNFLRDLARVLCINVFLPRLFTWCKNKTVSIMIPLHFIDYEKTAAFDPGHIGSMGGIYINERGLKGRWSYEMLRDEIIGKLNQLGKQNNWGVEALKTEQIYGAKTDGSPDIILRINDGRCVILKEFDGQIVEYNKLPDRISFLSGTHRMDGVFIAAGPDFAKTKLNNAKLWDITPTILHIYGESIPSYMEGQVLQQAVKCNARIKRSSSCEIQKQHETKLTEGEEQAVRKQLSDLGYFD